MLRRTLFGFEVIGLALFLAACPNKNKEPAGETPVAASAEVTAPKLPAREDDDKDEKEEKAEKKEQGGW